MGLRKGWAPHAAGVLFLLLLLSVPHRRVSAEVPLHHEPVTKEYRIKAAFISHFLGYTTWPEGTFEKEGESDLFVFGLIGHNPFGEHLKDLLKEKKIHERKISYKTCKTVEETETCHALFVSPDALETHSELLSTLRGKSILLIGESGEFAATGGMLGFYTKDDRVRFEACPGHIKESELTVSSRLLKLARIVESKVPEEKDPDEETDDIPEEPAPGEKSRKGKQR